VVRRSRWTRGVFAALLVLAGTLLLSGCNYSEDVRWGWPTGATKQAERMRVLWSWVGLAALILGAIVWGLIFWCCIRYRRRDDRIPRQTKYNLFIESICVGIPLVVILVLFWRTVVVENYVDKLSKHPDVIVQVNAFQWNWQFEYHTMKSPSGRTVRTVFPGHQDLTDTGATVSHPLYVSTVGSSNEIPVLVLPVNERVQIIEHSEDVIHSFWVPEFLFKRDVIPYGTQAQQNASGLRDNRFQIVPTHRGSYVGRCAELCGTYHWDMNFEVRVVSPQLFRSYVRELTKLGPNDPARQHQALAAVGMPPYATTTRPFPTNRTARHAIGSTNP
jgi:cytochrome c oxidase subunit 2